jgi:predicted Zn-dependent peptidase
MYGKMAMNCPIINKNIIIMPYYYEDKLKNGLRLFTIPSSGTKTATLLVLIGTGSKHEGRTTSGLSHFVEHMMFKGTERRPNTAQIAMELDVIGGEFNAFTSKEYTGYYVKAASSKISVAADVLSDMMLNSKFDQEEIDREKGAIIEEFNMYEDNPLMKIEDVFEDCLYGDTPAGWSTLGTKDNVRNFKRADFIKYISSQYSSEKALVCIAGDISLAESRKLAEKHFYNWKKASFKEKLAVKERQAKPVVKIINKKTDQIHLAVGVRSVANGHQDETAVKLLSIILGGSMSSRLFLELRERRGLAYYVHTSEEAYSDCGYLYTKAGIPSDKLQESLKVILSEYKRIATELIPEKELRRAKDMVAGRLAIQLESSDDLASWYGRQALLDKELLSPAAFLKKIKAVKASDLQRVAKKIFQDKNLNLAAIGPINGTAAILKKLSLK